jgi:hypothetical protein
MVEVVEAFGLCPWARDARTNGRVNLHVTFLTTPDPIALAAEVDVCMQSDATEIGMLLCPLLALTSLQWRHLSADVRVTEQQQNVNQRVAIADFHPNAAADLTTPDRLVPFLRRSPDLMLQIVRTDVLTRVRRSQEQGTSFVDPSLIAALRLDQLVLASPAPSLTERVAQNNLRTIQRVGVSQLAAILEDIQADRNRAYAAFGVASPTHAHTGDSRSLDVAEKPASKAGYAEYSSAWADPSHTDSSLRKCNDI